MVTTRPKTSRLIAATAVLLLAGQAATTTHAAILYGDFSDIPPGAVLYSDVKESSSSDPVPPPLYGAPSIFVNTLDFDPTGFGATSVGPIPGADITEGQLNFGFQAIPGSGIAGFTLSESGDFTLTGSGTAITHVSTGLYAQFEITHVNGTALPASISVTGSSSFTADLANSPGLNQPWSLSLAIDFGPALTNAGFNPQTDFVTAGELVSNNGLIAVSEGNPSTVAQLAKKDYKVNPWVAPIPEPGSIALLAIGGLACVTRRRR